MKTFTCSAPGKILLAGGYLVLDPVYTGLVLSLSARIFTTVTITDQDKSASSITVRSPQFPGATWSFSFTGGSEKITPDSGKDNAFVREALQTVLTYFSLSKDCPGLEIIVHADNQYYSLPEPTSRFAKSEQSIQETPKTGLGSSAALITSLCAALYVALTDGKQQGTLSHSDTTKVHNLAQISHCRAQGKVGSGFDVASAVYGSCNYSRFDPALINNLPTSATTTSLRELVDKQWQMGVEQVALRPGLALLMGDVARGSSTPGMVKQVQATPAALDIWPSLNIANDLLSEYLTSHAPYIPLEQSRIRETTKSVRGLLKQMGIEAKVDIEPDSQTEILDETLAIDGVVACGVPGAGGFDAIFAIVATEADSASESVRELWSRRGVTTLDLGDDGKGIRIERDFVADN